MITKEILKAQLDLYMKGRQQTMAALEKAKADVNAFNGAIETCENFIRIEDELTAEKVRESDKAAEEAAPKIE